MRCNAELMKQAEVLAVEQRPEACLGCGFEHSCSLHGCAVIKALIELAKAEKDNGPLTLEELQEMDGEPVWIKRFDGGKDGWAIYGDMQSIYGVYFKVPTGGMRLPYDGHGTEWLAYRRKPEEGQE